MPFPRLLFPQVDQLGHTMVAAADIELVVDKKDEDLLIYDAQYVKKI